MMPHYEKLLLGRTSWQPIQMLALLWCKMTIRYSSKEKHCTRSVYGSLGRISWCFCMNFLCLWVLEIWQKAHLLYQKNLFHEIVCFTPGDHCSHYGSDNWEIWWSCEHKDQFSLQNSTSNDEWSMMSLNFYQLFWLEWYFAVFVQEGVLLKKCTDIITMIRLFISSTPKHHIHIIWGFMK